MENFYTIYGDERGKIKYECQKLIEQIKNNSDIIRYDMNTTDLLDIIDDASTIAMFSQNKIIILDEPVAGLDPKVTEEMYELISSLNKEGTTIIMISHDLTSALEYSNKILHIGKDSYFGTKEEYIKSELGQKFINVGGKHNGWNIWKVTNVF